MNEKIVHKQRDKLFRNKIITQIFLVFAFIIFFFFVSGIKVYANDAYFLAITIDEAANCYRGEVVSEDGDHREKDLAGFENWVDKSGHKMVAGKKLPALPSDNTDPYTLYDLKQSGNTDLMYYTFPSIHSKGILLEKVDASDKDLALVQRVIDYPLNGLNEAISFILSATNSSNQKTSIRDIGMHLGNYDKSFEVNGVTVTAKYFSDTSGAPIKDIGIEAKDYATITINGESQTFVAQCNKGYYYSDEDKARNNDPLYYMSSSRYNEYKKQLANRGDIEKITWRWLVLQGNFNFDNGTTYSSVTNITAPNEFITMLVNFFDNALNSIRNMLGLYSIEELMTNNGSRSANYNLGMFPRSWTNAAVLLHVICQMIAWALIGFSIIKMLWKKQIATMNVGEKITLQESIKNLILCGFLLGSFTLIFNFLARLNYRLVDLFTASTTNINLISASSSNGTIGAVVVAVCVFVLNLYFNFYYIIRSVQLAILYGLAPLCIYTLSLGGKIAGTFTTFMKELLGNMFTQTIHALCIAFFSNVFLSGNTRTLETLVILYSFIPITKFIRNKVFGLEDGFAGMGAQQVANTVTSGAAAAAGGFFGSKAGNKVGSGRKGNAENNDGVINQAIDSKTSNPTGDSDITMKDDESGGFNIGGNKNKTAKVPTIAREGYSRSKTLKENGKALANNLKGDFVNPNSGLKKGISTAGKAALDVTKAGALGLAGVGVGAIDPSASKAIFKSAGSNLRNVGSDIKGGYSEWKSDNNFANQLSKNGCKAAVFKKDYADYELSAGFGDTGQYLATNAETMNQGTKKDLESMYNAQSALANATGGNFNDIKTSNIESAKASGQISAQQARTLNNMVKNQTRLHCDNDGNYHVIRRAEDIRQMPNPLDRANPMSGTKIRPTNENRNYFSNREKQDSK